MYPFDRLASYIHTGSQNALINILASGPVPGHIAFVMDGNRRYARMHQKEVKQGHSDGFIALQRVSSDCYIIFIDLNTVFVKVLEICLKMGVRCVSVYAFAIENFKRSEGEVAALMQLAETKLVEICQHGYVDRLLYFRKTPIKNRELLDKYGVRLNIIGKTELLPPAVQEAMKNAEDLTRNNNRYASLSLFFLKHRTQCNAEQSSTCACPTHPLTKLRQLLNLLYGKPLHQKSCTFRTSCLLLYHILTKHWSAGILQNKTSTQI